MFKIHLADTVRVTCYLFQGVYLEFFLRERSIGSSSPCQSCSGCEGISGGTQQMYAVSNHTIANLENKLVVEPTHLKHMLAKMGIFPK